MDTSKTYAIAPFGLTGYEIRVLQTICQLSKTRPRTYGLRDAGATQPIDIAIVDQDDAEALAAWRHIKASNPLVPVLTLTKHPVKNTSSHQLGRPLMATRLLELLDDMQLSNERPAFKTPEEFEPSQENPEVQDANASMAAVAARGSLRRALVVDDSLPIRRHIEFELAPLVGQVELAEHGEQAMELIARKTYDIVFLDVVLPGMDGYKVCRQIKSDRRTKETPVIMLSGKTSRLDRVRGKLAGCDTFLTKPVDHAALVSVVQKHLHEKQLHEKNTESFGSADMLHLGVPERV